MMAHAQGTARGARQLASVMKLSRQMLGEKLDGLDTNAKQISAAWQDDGIDQVTDIVSSIKKALESTSDNISASEKALETYAQFLDSIGKP